MVVAIQQMIESLLATRLRLTITLWVPLYCVVMFLHAYVDVYVLCVCIVGHGGDSTTFPFN